MDEVGQRAVAAERERAQAGERLGDRARKTVRGARADEDEISDGKTGVRSRWPAEALDRAQFTVEARKFHALHEIEALVRERWGDDKDRR